MAKFECGNLVSAELLCSRLRKMRYANITTPVFCMVEHKKDPKPHGVFIVEATRETRKEAKEGKDKD